VPSLAKSKLRVVASPRDYQGRRHTALAWPFSYRSARLPSASATQLSPPSTT
jgi:hypothetical protein